VEETQSPKRLLMRSFLRWHFKSRRLEDRIRDLCAKAVVTTDPEELNEILQQLSSALHDQVERIRNRVSQPRLAPERRFSRT
jgi:hypothetical protein